MMRGHSIFNKRYAGFLFVTAFFLIVITSVYYLFAVFPERRSLSYLLYTKSRLIEVVDNLSKNRTLFTQYVQLDPLTFRFYDNKSTILEEIEKSHEYYREHKNTVIPAKRFVKSGVRNKIENINDNLTLGLLKQESIYYQQSLVLEEIGRINSVFRNIYIYEAEEDFKEVVSVDNYDDYSERVSLAISGMRSIIGNIDDSPGVQLDNKTTDHYGQITNSFVRFENHLINGDFDAAEFERQYLISNFPRLKIALFEYELSILTSGRTLNFLREQTDLIRSYDRNINEINEMIQKHSTREIL